MNALARLDIFDSPPSESLERVLEAFDRLGAGQGVELVTGYDAKPFLNELREKYSGGFDWWRLEQGPELWRVKIVKRDNTEAWSITDFLGVDHHRLADLWQDCMQGVQACNLGHIQTRLAEFVLGLRHHIHVEEQIFFPVFEERTGMQGTGPTAVMRHEHCEIEAMLEKLFALTKAQACSTIVETIQGQQVDPSALLTSHDAKEENILYPMADKILNHDERRQLILRMQAG